MKTLSEIKKTSILQRTRQDEAFGSDASEVLTEPQHDAENVRIR
jgi:hypothetical protein